MEGKEYGTAYRVYKGLQKPLVFRAFKGKFIYYGVGSMLLGLVATMIVSALANIVVGLVTMIFILGGGLTFTALKQRKGLHSKRRDRGVYIIPHKYRHCFKHYKDHVEEERI